MRNQKGFTLTEILVVVLIMVIVSAIAYPLYTKSVNKARAVEAVNLIQIAKARQVEGRARNRKYFNDFAAMGQLTADIHAENRGATAIIGNYVLSMKRGQKCLTATYMKRGHEIFSFSASYENPGLGCQDAFGGSICASFGNTIVASTDDICNCNAVKNCPSGYQVNQETCACDVCNLGCDAGGRCFMPYGGGQSKPCESGCGTQTSSPSCGGALWDTSQCSAPAQKQITSQSCNQGCGTQTRTCSASCGGGSCGGWSACSAPAPSQNQATSIACTSLGKGYSGGTATRTCTASCGGGNCGSWNEANCTSVCNPSGTAPAGRQSCGYKNIGTQTRSVTWNYDTCQYDTGSWSECSTGNECEANSSRSCGNCNKGTQKCNAQGTAWGSCSGGGVCSDGVKESRDCGSGYSGTQKRTCSSTCTWGDWIGTCTPTTTQCSGASSESCGNCGTRTRTCNTSTGEWNNWSSCSGQGECSPNTTGTQNCPSGQTGKQTRTCSSSCKWGSWNASSCSCPYDMVNRCENGYVRGTVNHSNCTCSCPSGSYYDESGGDCWPKDDCPSGQTWNGTACVCPSGYQNVGGKCVLNCSISDYLSSHKSECCPAVSISNYTHPSYNVCWRSTGSDLRWSGQAHRCDLGSYDGRGGGVINTNYCGRNYEDTRCSKEGAICVESVDFYNDNDGRGGEITGTCGRCEERGYNIVRNGW